MEGLKILDCGCGEGRFCRMPVERSAKYVLGLDLCGPMIEAAKQLQSDSDEYRVADVQNLDFIEEKTFYHRSLSTYLDGFFEAGFTLQRIMEPTVTVGNLKRYPENENELRVPNFIIYILRKP